MRITISTLLILILSYPVFGNTEIPAVDIIMYNKQKKNLSGFVRQGQKMLMLYEQQGLPGAAFSGLQTFTFHDIVKGYDKIIKEAKRYGYEYQPKNRVIEGKKIIIQLGKLVDAQLKNNEEFSEWFSSIGKNNQDRIKAKYLKDIQHLVDSYNLIMKKFDKAKESGSRNVSNIRNSTFVRKSDLSAQLVMAPVFFRSAFTDLDSSKDWQVILREVASWDSASPLKLIGVFSKDNGISDLAIVYEVILLKRSWKTERFRFYIKAYFKGSVNDINEEIGCA